MLYTHKHFACVSNKLCMYIMNLSYKHTTCCVTSYEWWLSIAVGLIMPRRVMHWTVQVATHKHSVAWSMVALLGLWAAPPLMSKFIEMRVQTNKSILHMMACPCRSQTTRVWIQCLWKWMCIARIDILFDFGYVYLGGKQLWYLFSATLHRIFNMPINTCVPAYTTNTNTCTTPMTQLQDMNPV